MGTTATPTDRPSPGGKEVPAGPEARFACAWCGATAAIVRAVPAGHRVGFDRPSGSDTYAQDGVYVRFLGEQWTAVEDPDTYRRLTTVLAAPEVDASALWAGFPALARFRCPACERCYCAGHWVEVPVFDDGFYDFTTGTCPRGHETMIDD